MRTNIGNIDKIGRIVIGVALLAATVTGMIGLWGWIGVVPLLTGLAGYCPLYQVFGFSTCPMKQQ
jgi:uncharacterized membrane protein YfcA